MPAHGLHGTCEASAALVWLPHTHAALQISAYRISINAVDRGTHARKRLDDWLLACAARSMCFCVTQGCRLRRRRHPGRKRRLCGLAPERARLVREYFLPVRYLCYLPPSTVPRAPCRSPAMGEEIYRSNKRVRVLRKEFTLLLLCISSPSEIVRTLSVTQAATPCRPSPAPCSVHPCTLTSHCRCPVHPCTSLYTGATLPLLHLCTLAPHTLCPCMSAVVHMSAPHRWARAAA